MWRSLANSERLSRREPALRIAASRAKYPSFLPLGGDAGPGLAIELWPLAELELLRLRPFRNLARCILAKFGCPPGENKLDHKPLLPDVSPGKRVFVLACGVIIMGSSLSSGSSGSISSEELLESSDPIMLILPTELDAAILSPWLQPPAMCTLGDSINMELERGFREGIFMPFCVIVGEESGEDWSGTVEWCRLVQARENSAPRERRGSKDAGEA